MASKILLLLTYTFSITCFSIGQPLYKTIEDIEEYANYELIEEGNLEDLASQAYLISVLKKNSDYIVLFSLFIGEYPNDSLKLLDKVKIDSLSGKKSIGFQFCIFNDELDTEIVAVVLKDDKEYFTSVEKAWRADRINRKLIPIDTLGISCWNIDYMWE
ncbi:MAG: hypothetical protein HOD63_10085 [Bacteroidetes bacterium]|nr:hypothetical protein [Bacteroidota bacterium]MBT5529627.1 hypothetical protein [Cytophagia bacterium]MBT3424741.1 hypothetical protein [Bacteroidota bacterium]MBT3800539.1 hypothetical protein [Bacteroidota bacterium]MBT3933825.1 hypothetical protein [Bacteroidota bacterium]